MPEAGALRAAAGNPGGAEEEDCRLEERLRQAPICGLTIAEPLRTLVGIVYRHSKRTH